MHSHQMTSYLRLAGSLFGVMALSASALAATNSAQLIEVRRIWDQAPHNAFTDLINFEGNWFCVFREGRAHVAPDGVLRVITSKDGQTWTSAALLTHEKADLRDAKITVTPDHQLMLSGAAAWHQPRPIVGQAPRPPKASETPKSATGPGETPALLTAQATHQSMAWFSKDGHTWSDPVEIGEPNFWLWRTTWHDHEALSIGYDTAGEKFIRLYSTRDGRHFQTLVPNLFDEGKPNETSILFQPDNSCLCLLRRDGTPSSAKLGIAQPPYTNWLWKDLGARIGGPHLLRLPDDRIVAAGRLYDGQVRTSLLWLDAADGKLNEFLKLPSGGDNSYPGLVWRDGLLWVSYYSSHEGKASIYLAKVKLN